MQQAPTYGAVPSAHEAQIKSRSDEERLQDAMDDAAAARLDDFVEESPAVAASLKVQLLQMARSGKLLECGQIDEISLADMIAEAKAGAERSKAKITAARRRRRGVDSDDDESDSDLM